MNLVNVRVECRGTLPNGRACLNVITKAFVEADLYDNSKDPYVYCHVCGHNTHLRRTRYAVVSASGRAEPVETCGPVFSSIIVSRRGKYSAALRSKWRHQK